MQKNTPVLIHVPHSSTYIPSEEEGFFVVDRGKLQYELDVMTDHYCDELFDTGDEMVRFPVSRLVCDPERFRNDCDEVMSAVGMGTVYTKCSDGVELKKITSEHREVLLKRYYDGHHKRFEAAVERKLDENGECIIIDGHSFYEEPLPYELDQDRDRPDICIGTDSFHTPECITDGLMHYFEQKGYRVEINKPFAGTMIPMKYYHKNPKVMSVMIEVNRKLYMNREYKKTDRFEQVREDIAKGIRIVNAYYCPAEFWKQLQTREERERAFEKMSREQIWRIINECHNICGKIYISKTWQKLTGLGKY
jgi:N-formylglutamate amidohydrolase